MSQTKTKLSRRNFLIAASAGSAASAAALIAGKAPQQSTEASAKDGKRGSSGYKVSEHINNYYRTAKV